jgi:hypothetical protein
MGPKGLSATRWKSFYDAPRSHLSCRSALSRSPAQGATKTEFSVVLDYVIVFADPIIGRQVTDGGNWHPQQRQWRNDG